jgi:hypothetical protein
LHLSARVLALLTIACAACSSKTDSAPATGDPHVKPTSAPIHFSMAVTVPAGSEVYRCQFMQMPKAAAGATEIMVTGTSHEYTPGSHHFLVYRTSLFPADLAAKGITLGAQTDCMEGGGVMAYARGYVAGGQKPKESYDLPAGIAIPFQSEEVLLFQSHYVNASKAPLDAKLDVEMRTTPTTEVQTRAGVLRFYNPFIWVGAKAKGKAHMRCPILHDITILGAGPHMHQRGVAYRAWFDEAGKADATEPFYSTNDWEHPENYVGPLVAKQGSHVRFECDYQNDADRTFIAGASAPDNEMCMFSGIYYPEMKLEEESCYDMDEHGTGTATCNDALTCMQTCPREDKFDITAIPPVIGECFQKCVATNCQNASGALLPMLQCMQDKCATDCAAGSDACTACMTKGCPAVSLKCVNLACDAP